MTPLDRISERVNRGGDVNDPSTQRPLLALNEFFLGNTVAGSIGCNLTPPPPPRVFYEVFRSILDRHDVDDIRIQITAFDAPEWPFSDTAYVMTTAAPDEVSSWFPAELRPDRVSKASLDESHEPYDVADGFEVVECWWD